MIWGRDFAWAHIPRTAGDACAAMLSLFDDIIDYRDDIAHPVRKHATFAERGIMRPTMALGIRRLPAWTLSAAVFRLRTRMPKPMPGDHPTRRAALAARRRRAMPKRGEVLAEAGLADQRLLHYTAGGRIAIHWWLRAEYLRNDVIDFVAQYRDVTPAERDAVGRLSTKAPLPYDHDAAAFFGPEGVRALYAANPSWAAVEEMVYR